MESQEDKGIPIEGSEVNSNSSNAEEIKDEALRKVPKKYEELIEELRQVDNEFKKQALKSKKAKKQLAVFRERTARIVEHPVNVEENVKQLKKNMTKDVAFARMDYDLVHREILDIKSCRTNLFMGTLGVLGAVGIAILGILGVDDPAGWQKWLPWAALVPVGLLTSAILATIHKARGINLRVGYLEALAEYLAYGKVPPFYGGWTKAKFILDRCRIHPGKRETIESRDLCPENTEVRSCTSVAKQLALSTVKILKWRPDLLHSFTSLSTHIYTFVYFVSILSLLMAIMSSIEKYIPTGFSEKLYVGICGATFTVIFVIIKLAKKGVLLRNFSYVAAIVVSLLFLGLPFVLDKDELNPSASVIAYVLGSGISSLGIIIARLFYNQVTSLRMGRHSRERWYNIWKVCFSRCPLVNV